MPTGWPTTFSLSPPCPPPPLQMNLLLREYLLSGEVSEAEHCLRQLEVPHFHHELVYEVEESRRKAALSLSQTQQALATALQTLGKASFPALST